MAGRNRWWEGMAGGAVVELRKWCIGDSSHTVFLVPPDAKFKAGFITGIGTPTRCPFPGRSMILAPLSHYIFSLLFWSAKCVIYNWHWWRAGLWWPCSHQLCPDSCPVLNLYCYQIGSSWTWMLPWVAHWAEFTDVTRWEHPSHLWRSGTISRIMNTHSLHK